MAKWQENGEIWEVVAGGLTNPVGHPEFRLKVLAEGRRPEWPKDSRRVEGSAWKEKWNRRWTLMDAD
jgi:hypothetical protein